MYCITADIRDTFDSLGNNGDCIDLLKAAQLLGQTPNTTKVIKRQTSSTFYNMRNEDKLKEFAKLLLSGVSFEEAANTIQLPLSTAKKFVYLLIKECKTQNRDLPKLSITTPTYNKDYYNQNKERIKLYQSAYASYNADKISARNKLYYQANREKLLARSKASRKSNPDYMKDYRVQNKAAIKQQRAKYLADNKEAIRLQRQKKYKLLKTLNDEN